MPYTLSVAVLTPAHIDLARRADAVHLSGLLSYSSSAEYPPGTLVRVPLGKRETLGIVWRQTAVNEPVSTDAHMPTKLREITAAFELAEPLNNSWRKLIEFTAAYYHRSVGEIALNALPPALRSLSPEQWARRQRRKLTRPQRLEATASSIATLTPEQNQALENIQTQPGPFLLFGATGSGKTEVYLQAVHRALLEDPSAQVLILVPEINLTPQLEERFLHRFAPIYGTQSVIAIHSGLTPAQRLSNWLASHRGAADHGVRIILGTRMAIFASIPGLKLIVVDEEHDPSYKSQDGARFSARDLAVYRGRLEGAKVILGSATPALESWRHAKTFAPQPSRYQRVDMPSRIGLGALPKVVLVDMTQQPAKTVFAPALVAAITQRLARGEQCMVLLNRRGYAPVLSCLACGWKSDCAHCSAHKVFHKIDRTLRCHHCGLTEHVPKACPECGNIDISPIGRGTEQIEEQLTKLFDSVLRPDGRPARVLRIDADSTRQKGELGKQLSEVHGGDIDILVGTQMIAKGHDFRRVTLVAAINPDGALFSSDFRAPERMFALLMQAAGRAGRDCEISTVSEMWVQTHFPGHPLFQSLKRHDYPGFADRELSEREQAGMPPYSFQALVRADAATQEAAQAFLNAAADAAHTLVHADQVTRYPCVPLTIQRVANVERAQMLIESQHRPALHAFLDALHPILHSIKASPTHKGILRWAIDVDPLLI